LKDRVPGELGWCWFLDTGAVRGSSLKIAEQKIWCFHQGSSISSMKRDWNLTEESFELLLEWLDSDRDQAGEKYERIRLRLIKIFTCRGCCEADDLADETMNRVAARLGEIVQTYSGDPALYFYGVAQKVHLEYMRKKATHYKSSDMEQSVRVADAATEIEEEYACLERCMQRLPRKDRQLVLEYYQEDKRAKIDHRKQLADQLGIAVNALRIRAHRIRLQLQECVQHCLEQSLAH
jgi:RNA polymerase sigma factor (sigma-70 family)